LSNYSGGFAKVILAKHIATGEKVFFISFGITYR